ncbi:MAG: nucleoside deaminase, partial [Mucilaginibacter sp.]
MQEHEKFMRIAIELSEQNVKQGMGGPFGAVIVKDGEIIAQSANQVIPQNDPTAHAEVSAIRLACKQLGSYNLQGCIIYTSCEPCPMCLGAIYWAHINVVYYGNTKSDAASIG